MSEIRFSGDRLWAAGLLMCADEAIESPAPADVVWQLTREAARTISAMPGSALGRGLPNRSAWPEFQDDNFFAVLRERITDRVEGEVVRIRTAPTAAALDRSEAMWHLWGKYALPKLGKRRLLIKAAWTWAGGVRFRKIREATGLSRYRLNKARTDGCHDVSKHLLGL